MTIPQSVVALSGGQDSATTLALAATLSHVRAALFFDYGQRHAIEQDSARHWADAYDVPLVVVPVPSLAVVGQSALTGPGEIDARHPRLHNLPASFVPGRNLVFLTLAAAHAMTVGATQVWTGVCQTDYSGYPDCRESTILALAGTLRLGMDYPDLEIKTPLMHLTKAQTFRLASNLGVLDQIIQHTHTCYEGDHETRHAWGYGCGRCPACMIRARGHADFLAGRFDPPDPSSTQPAN